MWDLMEAMEMARDHWLQMQEGSEMRDLKLNLDKLGIFNGYHKITPTERGLEKTTDKKLAESWMEVMMENTCAYMYVLRWHFAGTGANNMCVAVP